MAQAPPPPPAPLPPPVRSHARAPHRALLAIPNTWLPWFGKCLFSAVDLCCGYVTWRLVQREGHPPSHCIHALALALFNPISINVSTRGSSDGLVALSVLTSLAALRVGRPATSGALLGLAVHLKLYPILYALPLALALATPAAGPLVPSDSATQQKSDAVRYEGTVRRVASAALFLLSTSASFTLATTACYLAYGAPYLHHALTYHLSRADNRHNFSPSFYGLYLADGGGDGGGGSAGGAAGGSLLALLAFLPQLVCVAVLGALWCRTPARALLLQTLCFVAMNKVVTAQYFTWWMALLPLSMPADWWGGRLASAATTWLATELLWGANAYWLEIQGQDHFVGVALAGALLTVSSLLLLVILLR